MNRPQPVAPAEAAAPAEFATATVRECIDELEAVHALLAVELGRREALQREVAEARAELAHARSELVDVQAEERRARHLALHDELTALPNRACFRERLESALADAGPRPPALAVIYIDLDRFKRINDAHGHPAGDEVLRIVAARLAHAVRGGDMMSRLGGDEFACLLPGLVDRGQLSLLAGKLLDAVAAPIALGPATLTVHLSVGVATCPADGIDAETLIRCADAAMYRAKQNRTGHVFYGEPARPRVDPATPRKSRSHEMARGIYF